MAKYKQTSSDSSNSTPVNIKAHSDDTTAFHLLTPLQQLNVRCDGMAKVTLKSSILNNTFMSPVFPDEDIVVSVNNTKIRSAIKTDIYKSWGHDTAKELFSRRLKVLPGHFDCIYWDGVGKAMRSFPQTFQGWTTRHISDFNGCHRYLSRFTDVENKCPSCGVENEDTCHISRCTDPIRTSLYQEDVNLLSIWLRDNHTPSSINLTLTNYLRHRGTRLMSSLIPLDSPLQALATNQDNLGFDNLLIGRLPKSLLTLMKPHLTNLTYRGPTAETWSRKLSQELLFFSHRQWTCRNSVKHFQPSEGMTIQEHDLITQQVQSLLAIHPSELLPQHCHLLSPLCAHKLGSSSTTYKQFWLAEFQSALDEAALFLRLKRTNIKSHNSYSCLNKLQDTPNINCPLFPTQTNNNNNSNKRRRLR
jgi:hypothetical protein